MSHRSLKPPRVVCLRGASTGLVVTNVVGYLSEIETCYVCVRFRAPMSQVWLWPKQLVTFVLVLGCPFGALAQTWAAAEGSCGSRRGQKRLRARLGHLVDLEVAQALRLL
jgi:hypothetical protein